MGKKKKYIKRLDKIHASLVDIGMEINGYGTLMGAIYSDDCIEGRDLLGPGNRLKENARKIQKICKDLDDLIIKIYQASSKGDD